MHTRSAEIRDRNHLVGFRILFLLFPFPFNSSKYGTGRLDFFYIFLWKIPPHTRFSDGHHHGPHSSWRCFRFSFDLGFCLTDDVTAPPLNVEYTRAAAASFFETVNPST